MPFGSRGCLAASGRFAEERNVDDHRLPCSFYNSDSASPRIGLKHTGRRGIATSASVAPRTQAAYVRNMVVKL